MSKRRLLRGVAGLALVTVSVVTIAVGASTAGAQAQEETAVVTREAYFTRPITQVTPPLLTAGFPPGTVCLVAGLVGVPEVCGEDVRDIVNLLGLSQGIPIPVTPDSHLVQVAPGNLPVGMLGGQERWASALQLRLPEIPDDQQFTSFELILQQDGLSFALESPAFRAFVFAVVAQISEPDPEIFTQVLTDVLSGDTPVFTETITGIEACPALEPWSGGAAQDAALDGSRLPNLDCISGTTGRLDPASATWTFDITFAVQAWTATADDRDALTNEGIFLRPLGAPNLAFGDPDLSFNFLVSLAGSDTLDPDLAPRIRYTTGPRSVAVTDGPAAAPVDVAPGVAPPVAAPPPAAPPVAAGPVSFAARWAERAAAGIGDTPWWLLLLVPVGLGGAYLFGEALMATPDVVRRRPGALSRMMERRARL